MENTLILSTQEAALEFVDTEIRQKWESIILKNKLLKDTQLGDVAIIEEADVEGHKVWQYTIEGLPVSRDGRKRWVLDTGATFDTTINEDSNTLEKAFAKS